MLRRCFTLALALVALASCSDSAVLAPIGGEAQLALLNALGTDESATVTLDHAALTLPASGGRSSRAISAGNHRLEARGSTGTLMAALDFTVPDGERRSAVIARTGSSTISLLMTTDTASLPPVGATKIRVIHAVDNVEPLKAWLRIADAPRDSSAAFLTPFVRGAGTNPEFPGYAIRPQGFYVVTATSLATGEVIAETGKHLANGQVWSAVLVRATDGTLGFNFVREN